MSHDASRYHNVAIESIAGLSAGVASTLVAHPLDVIKTRLQLDRQAATRIGSSWQIVQNLARHEGGLAAFYRGLTPNLVGNSTSWALYFVWYARIKDLLRGWRDDEHRLTYYDYFAASGAAGALTALCTNPIWVIKTRMLATAASHPGAYRSMVDGAQQIWRLDGVRGFYRGLLPSLFGVSHGALQFMAYEQLKLWRSKNTGREAETLSVMDYLLLSGAAKVFAGSITYPYQVVRARLQTYEADMAYRSARDVIRQVWASEGMSGFYKGLGPNLVRVVPSTGVTFLVYEKVQQSLRRAYANESQA